MTNPTRRHRRRSPALAGAALAAMLLCTTASAPVATDAGWDAAARATTTLAAAPDRHILLPGDVRMRYREIGEGTPVLLLHGYVGRLEMFVGLADSIAQYHRVIVPDLRGFGGTPVPPGPPDFGSALADDVVAFMDSLGLRGAHVLGHSMGALVAAQVALREPARGRVASLTLVAGPFYADSAALWGTLEAPFAALRRGEGVGPFLRTIRPELSDSAARAIGARVAATHDPIALAGAVGELHELLPDWGAVARTTVPAVIVVSRRDPMVGPARTLADRWPRARLVEIPDGHHSNVWRMPEVLEEFRRVTR